ncbi:Oar protein [Luteibacter rhizovicinus DSM 16549]|uniref:Oar protein n=1 Tax=Luteibacter rhizovicinus DSM 16549 TaxID=1440763 RepID=A0A0G9H2P2_9GAMM|nr:TonB-dependent receptor [Luteibacter rhizovicinus]APG05475.1 Oar protein [Luteibacter rhizovicinus DSM 16549]KLD63818.1 Oar protein [Luteibacter rhizovicinus DSM 16549]
MSSKTPRIQHALAAALALALSSGALAQSTTGSLFGQAPAAAGETVTVTSDTGLSRDVPVDERGRYSAGQLPLGTYTVSLKVGGKVVDTRQNITLKVGAGTEVSFVASSAQAMEGITVSAAALPGIDVSTVDSRTVVTSEQLARLPLGRNSEAIALLAPGVVNNGGSFKGPTGNSLVSFGGSAASENAYCVNGFSTTDPLRGFGGLSLPYGAIDQQEVYTGGYSAQYGRSDGGVINVVGKRGTNEWHFGTQVLWEPSFARADQRNRYFENGLPASPKAGQLYSPDSKDSFSSTTVSAYAGGPLIKDKLFIFLAGEYERQQGNTVNPVSGFTSTKPYVDYRYNEPRWYGKLDWNITDSNILEVTGASDKYETSGTVYGYDYQARTRTDRIGGDDNIKTGGDLWTAKYTGYITDDLTVTAQYGKLKSDDYDAPAGYAPDITYVDGLTNQNPALNNGAPRGNNQTVASLSPAGRGNRTTNTRIDITYKIGDHTITAGMDNQTAKAIDQGTITSGPGGYSWTYGQGDPNTPISTGLGVPATGGFPNGAQGYYVIQNINSSLATVRSTQRAQYIEDKWQINDRWLLSVGVRNDQFENFNSDGDPFVTQHKPQWAPRLGASWDVNGDATFKVYANAGRYYLGLPLNPALNAAGGALTTSQYFTYGGIAGDGTPTGLLAISPPVAANNTFGQLPDPSTVTTKGLKSEYQDEFILGFTKTLGTKWVYGAKATQRILRNAIDDYCDIDLVLAKAQSLGYDVTTSSNPVSCWLFNPGKANTFNLVDTSGNHVSVPLTNQEFGFDRLKRRYYALESFLEHPFDGTWYARATYVFSRSYGNTEGQLRSDLYRESRGTGQTAVSTTQDWDNSYIMVNTNGPQNNDHKHQLKIFGYYQITPEWLVSGNLSVISGAPKPCLGYFGPDREDPAGYGNSYHFCNGLPSPPGSHGRLPWVRQIDLGATYRPAFADSKLAFNANIFNVFNEQRVVGIYPNGESSPNLANPLYGTPTARQLPRYLRLSANYDF